MADRILKAKRNEYIIASGDFIRELSLFQRLFQQRNIMPVLLDGTVTL